MRRTIVAVDAVHAPLRRRGDLRGVSFESCARVLVVSPVLRSLALHPRDLLALPVAGDVRDLVRDVHVPVDAGHQPACGLPPPVLISMRTSCGVFVSSYA